MKVVYICNEISLSHGWGVLNYYTITEAAKIYPEVIVITLSNAENCNLASFPNIKIYPILTSMHDRFYKIASQYMDKINIYRHIDIHDVNIVHVLVEPLLPLCSIFKNSKKVFGIVGTYSDLPFRKGINRFLYNHYLKYIDEIVAISEYTKERFNNIYNQPLCAISLGVDYHRFAIDQNSVQEKAFVFVGHIKQRKGLIYALKAFKKIIETDKEIKFYIVGAVTKDHYAQQCIEYIETEKLSEQVIFLGHVNDQELVEIYHRSIANILTSINQDDHFEGFGLIHLEANACGIPSIGSKNCGNESAIVDGVTGFLCEQKNISDIETKMKLIIQDFENGKFNIWKMNCLKYAQENTWTNYFKKLNEKVYKA